MSVEFCRDNGDAKVERFGGKVNTNSGNADGCGKTDTREKLPTDTALAGIPSKADVGKVGFSVAPHEP